MRTRSVKFGSSNAHGTSLINNHDIQFYASTHLVNPSQSDLRVLPSYFRPSEHVCGEATDRRLGGICYRYVKERLTWHAAQAHCVSMGMNLAEIQNKEQNDAVFDLAKKKRFDIWIGLHFSQGLWQWAGTGHVNEPKNYRKWVDGVVKSGKDWKCVIMWTFHDRRTWIDRKCDRLERSVCQKSKSKLRAVLRRFYYRNLFVCTAYGANQQDWPLWLRAAKMV